MGMFFSGDKDNNDKASNYLEDQEAVFDTKGDPNSNPKIDDSYDEYVFHKKNYDDVPKYKASANKNLNIVIDKNEFGYDDIDPNVETVNIQKNDLRDDLNEIVNNAPIDDPGSLDDGHKSIYSDEVNQKLQDSGDIEVIDLDNDSKNMVVSGITSTNLNQESDKLSIFGNVDEPIQAKVYDVKQSTEEIKPTIDNVVEEPTPEPKKEIKINENGNKVCPNCGAPSKVEAPVCFLCGYKYQ